MENRSFRGFARVGKKFICSTSLCLLTFLLIGVAGTLNAQCNLPLHFGFDNPPEFDPATMEVIPTLTGQNGLLEIVNGAGAEGSAYYVRFSKSVDDQVLTQNALNLKMDLSGCAGKQLELSFYMRDDNDETQYYDGVFLSDGSSSFKRVLALEPGRWCDNTWGFFRVDLDELIAKAQLNYTSNFILQFRHEGKQVYNAFYGSDRDNFYIDEVRVYEAHTIVPASIPFKEGFSSGLQNDAHWFFQPMQLDVNGVPTDYSTPYEWLAKVNDKPSDGDGNSLFMGKWKNCAGEMQRNTADLHLNLSGLADADLELSFDFINYYDDTQPQDGVFLSSDGGITFKPAILIEPASWAINSYGSFHHIDLDNLIEKQGLEFTSDFVIRFQHQDEQSNEPGLQGWQVDGLYFDNIQVNIVPPVVYKQVPFCDNLDQANLNLDHWRIGNARIDTDGSPMQGETPSQVCGLYQLLSNGPKSWHLGKLNDGNGENINFLDLHIQAANLSSVLMSFELYEFWEEFQTEDGIFLSVDGGQNLEKIYDFNWTANPDGQWKTFQLNLSDLALTKNLTLSDQTVLRFGQNGERDWSGIYATDKDGYAIKNICFSGIVADEEPSFTSPAFSVFPNPTQGTFTAKVWMENIGDAQITLFNQTGRAVFEKKLGELPSGDHQLTIELDNQIPKGIYAVRFCSGEKNYIQKLIVN